MTTSHDELETRLRSALTGQAAAVAPTDRLDEIRRRTAHRVWFRSAPVLVAAVAAVLVLLVAGGLQLRTLGSDRARLVTPAGPASVSPAPSTPGPTKPSTPSPSPGQTDPAGTTAASPVPGQTDLAGPGPASPARDTSPTPSSPRTAGSATAQPPGSPRTVLLARGATTVAAVTDLLGRYGLADQVQVGEATTRSGGRAEVTLLPADGPPSAGPVGTALLTQQGDGSWAVMAISSDDLAVNQVDRTGTTLLVTGAVRGYDRAVQVTTHDAGTGAATAQASSGSVSVTTGWQVRLPAGARGQVLVATTVAGYGGLGGLVVTEL